MQFFVKLHYWLCGRRILQLNFFEFFFKLISSNILHSTQFVDLSKSEFCFAKIAKTRLTVILTHVLICFRLSLVKFVKYHKSIYDYPGVPAGAGATAAPGCCPVVPVLAPGTGSGAPMPVISSPMAMSVSRSAGVTPTLRRS